MKWVLGIFILLLIEAQIWYVQQPKFGATIATTASSDTLDTLRTNTNSSLTSINTQLASQVPATTTSNTFAGTQTFSILASTKSTLTYASTTAEDISSYFKIGANGTRTATDLYGACTIWAPSQTIGATSTQQAVCQSATNGSISAITGITTDAVCNVMMASSTNTTNGGLSIQAVSASSTAGTLVLRIANFTGGTFTWSAAATSSSQWNYMCKDPL